MVVGQRVSFNVGRAKAACQAEFDEFRDRLNYKAQKRNEEYLKHFKYPHLKKLELEVVSVTNEKAVCQIVRHPAFKVAQHDGEGRPIEYKKNELVGMTYTFDKNFLD
jgi:hypothetical protein